jgi:predicted extracellular nuclease
VFVPCANAGAGELVLLSGTQHALFHVTTDNQGGLHLKSTIQFQGVSGIGQSSGDKYQATGASQSETTITAGSEQTLVNSFKIIGEGPGNNLLVRQTTHVTITANGDLTAFVNNFSVECR